MKATTVKVEGDLLRELERCRPPSQTLSAYVRTILEREVRRLKLRAAAVQYADFLRDAPEERAWLTEWEQADLAQPPRRNRR